MTTPILGSSSVSVAQAQRWARSNNATDEFVSLAPTYWTAAAKRGGVRPEIGFAESAKETGYGHFGGSDAQFSATPAMHNPAGMKTRDGSATATFPDWPTGIQAHLDHLALYAGAKGYPIPTSDTPDQRHFPFLLGTCVTVESLGGHYAPDPNYGVSIVNDYLVKMEATAAVTETWMPGATIERGPYDHGSHGGAMSAHDGLVMHVTTNWSDPGPFFSQLVNQASSHFWIRKDGEIVQFLPLEVASWAQSAGNYSYVSVETDGTVDTPLTDAQVAAFAKVYAWVESLQHFGFVLAEAPGQPGLGWHGMGGAAWGGHTGCPGDLRKAQRSKILALAHGGGTIITTEEQAMTDGEFIREAYIKWLGRPVDPAGYTTFRNYLAANPANGREQVITQLLASSEGQNYQKVQAYRLSRDRAEAAAAGVQFS